MRCDSCGVHVSERPLFRANAKGVKEIWRCTPCGGAVDPDPVVEDIVGIIHNRSLADNTIAEDVVRILGRRGPSLPDDLNTIAVALFKMQAMCAIGDPGPDGGEVGSALASLHRLRNHVDPPLPGEVVIAEEY